MLTIKNKTKLDNSKTGDVKEIFAHSGNNF